MKLIVNIVILCTILSSPSYAFAANDTVAKTVCKLAVGYETVDILQADLLVEAKREVINELFGELIVASTAVENFVVTSDQIRASSIGFVRIDGSVDFYNGESFVEGCVTINAYVIESDREKFEPVRLEKKYCDADKDLTTNQLISYVKTEAIVQALVEYEPELKDAERDRLLQLVQQTTHRDSEFIKDTQTYCSVFEGFVIPVEILAFLEESELSNQSVKAKRDSTSQWVVSVPDFSSEYESSKWSASQIIGEPNVPTCSDNDKAWAPKVNAGTIEFVEVEFEEQVYPQKVIVHESNAVGFVTKLEFLDPTGEYQAVEVEDKLIDCPGAALFDVEKFIDFPTNRVRIYVDTKHSKEWEEIDAVELHGFSTSVAENLDSTRSDLVTPSTLTTKFKSGTYQVTTTNGYNSTWTLEISNEKITGFSQWSDQSGETRMTGVISGNRVIIQRDWCSGEEDVEKCTQTFTGTLSDNVITGPIVGIGIAGNVTWTLYLE